MNLRGLRFPRLILAVVATLLVCLLCYLCVGWGVWTNQGWLERLVGFPRFLRWRESYNQAFAALLPDDRDNDGVCDGDEIFWGTDPKNPSSHPLLTITDRMPSFVVRIISDVESKKLDDRLLIQPGTRKRIQFDLIGERLPKHAPKGFHVRVTSPSFARIAAPGGSLDSQALDLPFDREGRAICDLSVLREAVSTANLEESLVITNAVTGEKLYSAQLRFIWPEHAVNATIARTSPLIPWDDAPGPMRRLIDLSWPPIDSQAEGLIIEAAEDRPVAKWFPIYTGYRVSHLDKIEQIFHSSIPYAGSLKFRVVPVHLSAP